MIGVVNNNVGVVTIKKYTKIRKVNFMVLPVRLELTHHNGTRA